MVTSTLFLDTEYGGKAEGFEEDEWEHARHPVFYTHKVGEGEVLYLTLGHCRHHHDMQPLLDYWPTMDRGSWDCRYFINCCDGVFSGRLSLWIKRLLMHWLRLELLSNNSLGFRIKKGTCECPFFYILFYIFFLYIVYLYALRQKA